MTAHDFIAKWSRVDLTERLYQPQFPGAGQLKTKDLLPLATEQQQRQPA
jgi:hypothetical protein